MHDANLDEDASLFNTSRMSVRIKSATIHRIELKTRIPFKYGIATMTEVPMIFVKVEVEINRKGGRHNKKIIYTKLYECIYLLYVYTYICPYLYRIIYNMCYTSNIFN